jgi:hypothetical protein
MILWTGLTPMIYGETEGETPTEDVKELETLGTDGVKTDDETMSIAEARKLRQESARRRKENQELVTKLEAKEKAELEVKRQSELKDLTEIDLLKKEKVVLEQKAKDAEGLALSMVKQQEVKTIAEELGFRNPNIAVKLISDKLSDIELSGTSLKNKQAVIDLLKDQIDSDPYLIKESNLSKTSGTPPEGAMQKNPTKPNISQEDAVIQAAIQGKESVYAGLTAYLSKHGLKTK